LYAETKTLKVRVYRWGPERWWTILG